MISDENIAGEDSLLIRPHSYRSRAKFLGQCRINKRKLKRDSEHSQDLFVEWPDVDPGNGSQLYDRERLNSLHQRHAL